MESILCLAVGYLFGLFQTGYIYSKLHHVDIRKEAAAMPEAPMFCASWV